MAFYTHAQTCVGVVVIVSMIVSGEALSIQEAHRGQLSEDPDMVISSTDNRTLPPILPPPPLPPRTTAVQDQAIKRGELYSAS